MSTRALTPLGVLVASADPATPTLRAGDLYFNSGTLKLRTYTGALWVDVDATVASTTVSSETGWGVSANAGSSTSLSKGDHTHGTPTLPVTAASGGNQITLGANQTGSITIAVTTTPSFISVASSGMTGAVAATRYAGGTSAGAPTSGTFVTGDWIIAQAGALWICTAGGTPGTWAAPGGVTSVNGGTNVNVSPTTGAVVVSLSTTPTFTSVTANASSTNGFRFSTGGTPAVYESFGVSIAGDTTHPVQVMSTALLVGQTGASGGTYTAGDVVATRLFEVGQRAHSANFGAATTVTGGSGFGQASIVGTLTTFAREDHQHSTHAALNAGDIAQGTFSTTNGQYNMPSLFMMTSSATATSGLQSPSSWQLGFTASYWTGAAAANATGNMSMNANSSGVTTLALGFGVTNTTGILQEGGIRVFSQTFGAATTSVATTTFGLSAVLGTTGAGWARGDHTHGTPSLSSSTPVAIGSAGAAGSVGTASDSGHTHAGFSSTNLPTLAQVAAGTSSAAYSFTGLVVFTGTTIIGNKGLYNGTRSLSGASGANSTVELGSLTSTTGAFQANVMLTVDQAGYSVTKSYEIDVAASTGSASTWYRVLPQDSTQLASSTPNFELEVNRNATTNTYQFRIRNVTAVAATLYFQIETYGAGSVTFTPSSTLTGGPVAAVASMWPPTPLFTGPGVVGIGTDNPAYSLDVAGSTRLQTPDGTTPLRVMARTNANGGQSGNLLEFTDAGGTAWSSFDAGGAFNTLLTVTANNLQAGGGLGSGQLLMNTLTNAASGSQNINSSPIILRTNYWTGAAAANDDLTLTAVHYSAASGRTGLAIANADAITFGTTGVISVQAGYPSYGDNIRFNRGAAGGVAVITGPSTALFQSNGNFNFLTGASATAGSAVTTTTVLQLSATSGDYLVPITVAGNASLLLSANTTPPTTSSTQSAVYTTSGRPRTKDGLGAVWPVDSPLPGRLGSTQTNSTVTSSVVDGTNLSAAIPGAGTYLIEWEGTYSTAATTTGLRLQINVGATGATGLYGYSIFTSNAGAAAVGGNTNYGIQFGSASASAAGSFVPWRVWTTVVCTGAGTIDLLFASGVAASAVNIQGGAYRNLTRIA